MLQDLRIAFRSLLKQPGFTLIAVLTLAIGIGAVTTVYSLAEAVLMQPLPFAEPDRLTIVYDVQPSLDKAPMSYPEYRDWSDQDQLFSAAGAFVHAGYNLTGEGDPERVDVVRASSGLLDVLGLHPALGRGFQADEEPPGAARVAMLTDGFWRRRFAADPGVIGRTVSLDGEPWTVVGVLPPEAKVGRDEADFWLPLRLDEESAPRGLHILRVLARLRPGLDLAAAQQQGAAVAERLAEAAGSRHRARIVSLPGELRSELAAPFLLFAATVACVLLIACVNVANLLLARSSGREREMAIRKSLGSNRRRLVRQLLTESALLAVAGGLAGLLLAAWGVEALLAIGADQLPGAADAGLNPSVLVFALLLSLATSLVFGLMPALRTASVPPMSALRGGTRRGGGRRSRLAPALVVVEVALSLVLLAGGGLLVRSLLAALDSGPGFRPDGLVALDLSLPDARYPDAAAQGEFFAQLRQRIDALPGVESSAEVSHLPLTRSNTNGSFTIEGRDWPEGESPLTDKRLAGPGYFRTMGIPVLRGRELDDRDRAGAAPVALINETLARRYFPGEDPIGQRIDFDWHTDGFQEIVGVVGDVKHQGPDSPPQPEIYVPYAQNPEVAEALGRSLVIRTRSGDPSALLPGIREQVYAVDAEQPVGTLTTFDQLADDSLAQRRIATGLVALLAAVALLLAAVGLYGVLAQLVSQRSYEIGVRMALGASRESVLGREIGRGMALAAGGAAVGFAGALAAGRMLSSLLYGVGAADPVAFTAAAAVLLAAALAACAVPARNASRVDPIRALRAE